MFTIRGHALASMSVLLSLTACSSEPGEPSAGEPGGACEPDDGKNACPDDTVCAEDAEMEMACLRRAGAVCDADAADSYCALGTRCVTLPDPDDDEKTRDVCAVEPGETCEEGDPCADETSCLATMDGDFVCGLALGEACERSEDGEAMGGDAGVAAKQDHCIGEAVCSSFPVEESGEDASQDDDQASALCALPLGATCIPDEADFCAHGLLCAQKEDGSHACFPPVVLRGHIRDSAQDEAIEGAHIIALNDLSEAVSDVAVSGSEGRYELSIPVVREQDGSPVEDAAFTLRVSAADYQTFPSGIRQAIPVLSSEAVREDGDDELDPGAWVIEGALTEVQLIALPAADRVTVSGSIATTDEDEDGVDDEARGTLVVAHGTQIPAPTAIADLSGSYTIFNVEPGAATVSAYKSGLQFDSEDIEVADEALEEVDLSLSDVETSTVTGNLNIVDAPGGAVTSVVLAVEDTFTEAFARGEVPAGCRTELDVTGEWSIEGVPAGRYVVLAAFENDGLVRDPDQNIAGTDTVIIEVRPGEDFDIAESFKVTQALTVVEPGEERPTAVSAPPTLEWEDDSSEDFYSVEVYNALGEMVWEVPDVPQVTGAASASIEYAGPMTDGMYYQFRVKSWRASGSQEPSPISATEDLRGVFYVQ